MYRIGILGNCCTHGAAMASLKNRPDVEVLTGYERNPRRAEELMQAMGVPLAADYEEVIARTDVDIIVLTTDPGDKAEMVEKCCAAGKHILLNKPLCASLEQAQRIVTAVRSSTVRCVFDIPMVKFLPAFSRLQGEVQQGQYGRPLSYHHAFGMTFAFDFPIRDLWPERFDPPAKAGGGEMTNMGCYAIDYVVTLFGRPQSVEAKWRKCWKEYREADVENFGQIVLDYGDFYALLSVGKQQLAEPRQGNNVITALFENRNFIIDAYTNTVIIDGVARNSSEYPGDYGVESSFDQLVRCIETDSEPDSNVETAAVGVEVLMAAYRSIVREGERVTLPLDRGDNPLSGEQAA